MGQITLENILDIARIVLLFSVVMCQASIAISLWRFTQFHDTSLTVSQMSRLTFITAAIMGIVATLTVVKALWF